MITWVNGALVDQSRARVSAFDHGFTVGDGVFETLKIEGGTPFALTRHLERLARSAAGLGLPLPDAGQCRLAVAEVIAANSTSRGRLRITYTPGPGPLGSARGDGKPTLIIAVGEMSKPELAVDVITVPEPRNERSALAGIKTTSYAENVIALARAARVGAVEALMPNTVGNLCEATGSNVFLGLAGELVTPPVSAGCLPGITRQLVLDWVGAQVRDVPMRALAEADEILLTSSTRDVLAVRRVDDRLLPGAPGPLTARAATIFAERAAADSDP